MLVSGGSNISDPNVRLLVDTPLTTNPTASSRLPAVLKASAPTPRIGRDENPACEGATVERNLRDGLCRDDMANRGGSPINDRHFHANEHRLSDVADCQMKVAHQ